MKNIFPEHLDHCNSIDDYINAKFNIADFQNDKDFFIYNAENELNPIPNIIIDLKKVSKENKIKALKYFR